MNIIKVLLILSVSIGFLGCKDVKIKDGKIPLEYADEVKPFLGDYPGEFNNQSGVLRLSMTDLTPKVEFISNDGDDILADRCNSKTEKQKPRSGPKVERTFKNCVKTPC